MAKCKQIRSLLISGLYNIQPSYSWQDESDALSLHEDHFLLALEECVSRWVCCSGSSHELSSAWDGGLNPMQRASRADFPNPGKTRRISRSARSKDRKGGGGFHALCRFLWCFGHMGNGLAMTAWQL